MGTRNRRFDGFVAGLGHGQDALHPSGQRTARNYDLAAAWSLLLGAHGKPAIEPVRERWKFSRQARPPTLVPDRSGVATSAGTLATGVDRFPPKQIAQSPCRDRRTQRLQL